MISIVCDFTRRNPAFEESEEDEEEESFVSVSQQGSKEQIVHAQPGPGMKSVSRKPPVARARQLQDEESESDVSEESGTEPESVATTRADQVS